ncbi:unnamed protein product [Cylindrotheca closterium]|uniref:Uncharacterized protein n=1 Tax=Cylindrotheca closterium TaxID=2856 RepID=A0AAD2FGA2_9STRA|nr:unnamed protein product [Cylindrotheca closterium]
MAEELFDNDFGTAMTKSIKQVNMDLAMLASLTAVQGRIVSRPRAQDQIRAFVQWVRDEIRMGRNPAQHPFPAGDTSTLLQRLNFHQKYDVKDSKTLIDNTVPPKWSKEQQWKQWVKLLRDHLRAYIGVNGIPLVYVVRENAAQDPTPQDDFLDEYINMALLVGTAFIVDNKQVLALLNKFIMGCSEAEMVIQALNTTTDGRAAFFALKAFYEGEGIFAHDVMAAENIIATLFYAGEKRPAMYWQKFEQILNNAYATMHHEYGRVMYTDVMKLRSLQQRIKADFLSQTKAAIETNMDAIPMTMTYDHRNRNKNNQDNASTNENTRNIAALTSLIGDLTGRLTVPTKITQDTAATQISHVTTGTNRRSIIGGRLQQAQQHQNGGSGSNI